MKDIEKELERQTPQPRRPLSADFTQKVIDEVRQPRQKLIWNKIRQTLHIRHLSKAGAVSLAAFVLVSGSVAAFALWPKADVQPAMTQKLPSGDRIVGYDAQNCKYFSSLDGTPVKPGVEKLYYEVRKDAPLTDQQLQDSLRAVCEENISNNFVTSIIHNIAKDKSGVLSTLTYAVTAITPHDITLSLDPHYKAADYTTSRSITYANFAKNMSVYDHGAKTDYGDIKVGDSVKMVVQSHSARSSETPENYNPLNHPQEITILAIAKIPALSGDPGIFERAVGTDLVRLDPCTESKTGFCRAYDFAH